MYCFRENVWRRQLIVSKFEFPQTNFLLHYALVYKSLLYCCYYGYVSKPIFDIWEKIFTILR